MNKDKLLEELQDIDVAAGYITAVINLNHRYVGTVLVDALKEVAKAQPELKLKDLTDKL